MAVLHVTAILEEVSMNHVLMMAFAFVAKMLKEINATVAVEVRFDCFILSF